MKTVRKFAAATAAVALAVTVAGAAGADPFDILSDPAFICQDATEWFTGELDDTYFGAFDVQDATVYPAPGCDPDLLQGDAFDDLWAIWVGDAEDSAYYGDPTDLTSYVVDISTAANGDVLVLGPVESLYGLDVQVEQRFYAEGDLVRVLATFTNPSAAAITVWTGTDSGYGSDADIEFIASTSGDTAVTIADSWAVSTDGSASTPVISNAWQLAGAAFNADFLERYDWHGSTTVDGDEDNLWTEGHLTVAPGATARLAFFSKVYGYQSLAGAEADVSADTFIGLDIAAAEAAAIAGTSEWASFSGRLSAGLPAGTVVLNWSAAAAPATPVVTRPTFTG